VEPPVEEVKLDSASPGDKNCRIIVFLECFDWTLSCTFVLSWNIDKGQLELFHFIFSISNLYFSVFKQLHDPSCKLSFQLFGHPKRAGKYNILVRGAFPSDLNPD
jgi:hypothetical protein